MVRKGCRCSTGRSTRTTRSSGACEPSWRIQPALAARDALGVFYDPHPLLPMRCLAWSVRETGTGNELPAWIDVIDIPEDNPAVGTKLSEDIQAALASQYGSA